MRKSADESYFLTRTAWAWLTSSSEKLADQDHNDKEAASANIGLVN